MSASTGSIVATVAARGASTSAASSPSRSPGPRTATITSRPVELGTVSLARPASRTITEPASSPSAKIARFASKCRSPPLARRSAVSSGVSESRNVSPIPTRLLYMGGRAQVRSASVAVHSAAEWAEGVRDAERRGELLTAFDLAERALSEHPDDLWLKHRAVLALARAGSTDEAARRFREYGLEAVDAEDVAALR